MKSCTLVTGVDVAEIKLKDGGEPSEMDKTKTQK